MAFFDECVPGVVPDFGAIFMCSSETRTECFRGKFFALPASYASFVKKACSDGAMNIVQHAHSSLWKRFPAQVKFTMIWKCDPLSEFEFCDAIKDNYFAAYKFKFGLSEHQVHRLLLLFSQRKLNTGNDFDRLISRGHSQNMYGKVSRPASDHSFKRDRSNAYDPIDSREDTCNFFSEGSSAAADHSLMRNISNDFDPMILRDHPQNLFNEGSNAVAEQSLMRNAINDFDPINSRDLPQNLFGERNSVAAHQSFMRNTNNDFDPINSRDHPRNLFDEGSSVAADHSLIRNTSNGFDPINSRDHPRNYFVGGSSATSDHNLMRHMSNDVDPINSRDHPTNLFCEASSTVAADHRQSRNYVMDNEEYQGISSGNKVRRVAYDDKLYANGWFENHHNLEYGLNSGISCRNSAHSLVRTKRIVDDANISLENEGDLVNNQFIPHSSSHSLDPRMSNHSYSRFNDDAVHSSQAANDPDSPNILFDRSLSYRADQNSDFVNNSLPFDNYGVRNTCSLSQNQSFQHHMQQPKALISLPKIKNCNCASCVAGIPPSLGHPKTTEVNSEDYERYTGLYTSESSLQGPIVRRTENEGLTIEGHLYSSYPFRKAALANENQYPAVSDECKHKMSPHENTKAFAPIVCSPDGPCYLQSTKQNCIVTHFDDNVESHGTTKGEDLYIPKKRNSIFERLSVALNVKKQVDDISMGYNENGLDDDISVDEIMGMLHRGYNCWMKAAKKSYPVESPRGKKHMSFSDKMLSIGKSKKMNKNRALENGDNPVLVDQYRPIVNFKRESVLLEKVNQLPLRDIVENSVLVDQDRPIINFKRRSQLREKDKQIPVKDQLVDSSPKIQPKKRKLVRPDLCKDVQVDDVLSKNQHTIRKLARPYLFKEDQVGNTLSKDQPKERRMARLDLFKDDQVDNALSKDQPTERKLLRQKLFKDDQSDDSSPKNKPMKRKLVRPDLLIDYQIDDSSPKKHQTKRKLVRPELLKDDQIDDTLPKNQPTKRRLVRPDLCKNDSSKYKDGNNVDISDKTTSAASECKTESQEKNQEEDAAAKKDIDKNEDCIDHNVGSNCKAIPNKETMEESIRFLKGEKVSDALLT